MLMPAVLQGFLARRGSSCAGPHGRLLYLELLCC
jgi:hypothetical protein